MSDEISYCLKMHKKVKQASRDHSCWPRHFVTYKCEYNVFWFAWSGQQHDTLASENRWTDQRSRATEPVRQLIPITAYCVLEHIRATIIIKTEYHDWEVSKWFTSTVTIGDKDVHYQLANLYAVTEHLWQLISSFFSDLQLFRNIYKKGMSGW